MSILALTSASMGSGAETRSDSFEKGAREVAGIYIWE